MPAFHGMPDWRSGMTCGSSSGSESSRARSARVRRSKLKHTNRQAALDDFVLFADSKAQLHVWLGQIALFLEDFRLKLNLEHCYIYPSRVGRRFLGQRVFRTHRLLLAENVQSFKRRQQAWQKSPPENLQQRLASWQGHAEQADTFGLLQALGLIEASPRTNANTRL